MRYSRAIATRKDTDMNKQELMTRYASAKFASYLKMQFGEHEAKIATKFALEYFESDFKKYSRQQSEAYALEILAMDVEDAETAASAA
jgi:hypothetical protein